MSAFSSLAFCMSCLYRFLNFTIWSGISGIAKCLLKSPLVCEFREFCRVEWAVDHNLLCYLTNYFKVDRLRTKLCREIIRILKIHLSRWGTPTVLCSVNSPFNSAELIVSYLKSENVSTTLIPYPWRYVMTHEWLFLVVFLMSWADFTRIFLFSVIPGK